MPKKNERGDPLGFFNIHSVAKSEKIEGGTLWRRFFPKKMSRNAKKLKGPKNPLVSSGIVCYAGNLFGSVPWANGYNWASSKNFVEISVELFWSLQVYRKKH